MLSLSGAPRVQGTQPPAGAEHLPGWEEPHLLAGRLPVPRKPPCLLVTVEAPGINGKMDEVRAAYGLLNLQQVDAAIEARKKAADAYRAALKDVKGIRFFDDMEGVRHNYSYFPIFVDAEQYGRTRDELYEKMKAANVYGRRYFYPLITAFDPYKNYPSASPEKLPVATKIADQVICLPMHHALSEEDVKRVIDCICR